MISGHMQTRGFNLVSVLQHASQFIVTLKLLPIGVEGGIRRVSYAEIYSRTSQLANALKKLGVKSGDRIGTMAWNTWRHLECWYAIGGSGAVCHTLNPRLFADQIDYIVNHAQDRFIFVDITFVPVLCRGCRPTSDSRRFGGNDRCRTHARCFGVANPRSLL